MQRVHRISHGLLGLVEFGMPYPAGEPALSRPVHLKSEGLTLGAIHAPAFAPVPVQGKDPE